MSRLHAVRTDADAALFEAAARFADLHSGDTLPRSRTVLPGMERAVQVGGGIHLWRDPHGQIYLVDHTGTRQITTPGHPTGPAHPHDPDIEIHPTTTIIETDFT